MSEYEFSETAYTKIIFHAAKYPHQAVNGLLLAEKKPKGSIVQITDAIPLFHQCLHVTPMAEVALMQVSYPIKLTIGRVSFELVLLHF